MIEERRDRGEVKNTGKDCGTNRRGEGISDFTASWLKGRATEFVVVDQPGMCFVASNYPQNMINGGFALACGAVHREQGTTSTATATATADRAGPGLQQHAGRGSS